MVAILYISATVTLSLKVLHILDVTLAPQVGPDDVCLLPGSYGTVHVCVVLEHTSCQLS